MAIGMFGMPEVGGVLMASHYIAVVLVGFLMRFHAGGHMEIRREQGSSLPLWLRAFRTMRQARSRDGRPIGQLFGDAVRSSLRSMLFVGGCIMMFSVFIRIMTVSGLVNAIAAGFALLLTPLGVAEDLILASIKGLVEITIGAEAVSQATDASLTGKMVSASAIVAWSGLSVHAQVAAMVHGSGIRLAPYIFARFLHAVFAGLVTWLMMGPLQPALTPLIAPVLAPLVSSGVKGFLHRLVGSLLLIGGITALLATVGTALTFKRRLFAPWVRR